MSQFARDLEEYPKYRDQPTAQVDEKIKELKRNNPKSIPYLISPHHSRPCFYVLCYQPRTTVRHEVRHVCSLATGRALGLTPCPLRCGCVLSSTSKSALAACGGVTRRSPSPSASFGTSRPTTVTPSRKHSRQPRLAPQLVQDAAQVPVARRVIVTATCPWASVPSRRRRPQRTTFPQRACRRASRSPRRRQVKACLQASPQACLLASSLATAALAVPVPVPGARSRYRHRHRPGSEVVVRTAHSNRLHRLLQAMGVGSQALEHPRNQGMATRGSLGSRGSRAGLIHPPATSRLHHRSLVPPVGGGSRSCSVVG